MSAKTGEADLFANALGGVLEDMAFIFTDQLAEDELSADPGESLAVKMSFLGPQRGTVTLAAQNADWTVTCTDISTPGSGSGYWFADCQWLAPNQLWRFRRGDQSFIS